MYKSINILLFLLLCLMFFACEKTLEDIPDDNEVVNGINVSWRKNVTDKQKGVVREILNNMQYIQGGIFLMGATQEQEPFARENERPAHYVRLSDFYIGKYEISIQQLEILLDKEFSAYERKHGAPQFIWTDWLMVLNLVSEYSGVLFDFPTEAQWEYVARGGNKGAGCIYSGSNTLEIAEDHENELGIVGMARGHSEWCKDSYNAYSGIPLEVNPCNLQGWGHVIRGGNNESVKELKDYFSTYSFNDRFNHIREDFRSCRVSARSYGDDSFAYLGIYVSCRFVINNNLK